MGAMIQSKRRNKRAEGGERKGEMDWRKQKFGFPVSVRRDNGGANRPKTGRVPVGFLSGHGIPQTLMRSQPTLLSMNLSTDARFSGHA